MLFVDELLNHAKAVQPRHLHIEEDKLRIVLANKVNRLDAVAALSHHFYIADALQQVTQLFARELLVVDNDSRNRHRETFRKVYRARGKRLLD